MTTLNLNLLLLILFPATVPACMKFMRGSSSGRGHPQGIWDELHIHRNIVTNCSCGGGGGAVVGGSGEMMAAAWRVFLVSKIELSRDNFKICLGTIITSNMILTSHKCLLSGNSSSSKFQVYDSWNPRPERRARFDGVWNPTKDILVLPHHPHKTGKAGVEEQIIGKNCFVEELIVNPNYALDSTSSSSFESNGANDVAILVVKSDNNCDFTAHPKLRPICLPPEQHHQPELDQQPSFIVGPNPIGRYVETLLYKVSGGGGIRRAGADCEVEGGGHSSKWRDEDRLLCVHYDYEEQCAVPMQQGSPLYSLKESTSFLLGISTNASAPHKTDGGGVVHFASIFPLVKYIEYQAHRIGSRWCATPKSSSPSAGVLQHTPPRQHAKELCGSESWPWKDFTPNPRDHSLNCECGIKNAGGAGASTHAVGGETALPREFGWMVKLKIDNDRFDLDGNPEVGLCGAAVINDRMLLTAANCFISKDSLILDKGNVRVFLNAHKLDNDPAEIQVGIKELIAHPGHLEGLRVGRRVYDIVLETPLKFPESGDGIRPICLPAPDPEDPFNQTYFGNKNGTVLGWGLTSYYEDENAKVADELQKLVVPILRDLWDCDIVAPRNSSIERQYLCAGYLNYTKDFAPGDPGGPLMVEENSTWTLAGFVSHALHNNDLPDTEGSPFMSASLYTDIQNSELMTFLEYYVTQVGAKWCKS